MQSVGKVFQSLFIAMQSVGKVMQAAGKRWRDATMDEWPENDHRIFVGDLGEEYRFVHWLGAGVRGVEGISS